tara:strand:- start:668 stop:1150 length:483 start_codon:yes stop_codon:yes gene_type:complete
MIIHWNKGLFAKTINLTDANGNIGFLRKNTWSTSATGVLNHKKYSFKTKGVFRKVVLITECNADEKVGNIHFSEFSSKAKINFKSAENTTLFARNFWQTKWRLSNEESFCIDYHGRLNKGQINVSGSAPEALILAGLFATNRIWEYTTLIAIIVAVIAAT